MARAGAFSPKRQDNSIFHLSAGVQSGGQTNFLINAFGDFSIKLHLLPIYCHDNLLIDTYCPAVFNPRIGIIVAVCNMYDLFIKWEGLFSILFSEYAFKASDKVFLYISLQTLFSSFDEYLMAFLTARTALLNSPCRAYARAKTSQGAGSSFRIIITLFKILIASPGLRNDESGTNTRKAANSTSSDNAFSFSFKEFCKKARHSSYRPEQNKLRAYATWILIFSGTSVQSNLKR